MATLQDQNINIHFDGAKNDASKALKKGGGGLGGRKALNDISNSAKPSSLQASKKNYSAKVPDKGGRKALTDLTNSSKPSAQHGSKKGLDKKLSAAAAANIPTSIAEEQFLHDHKKCIKAQRKVMDMDFFLEEVGLENDIPVQLVASPHPMLETPVKKHFEMEELPELLTYDQFPQCDKRGPSLGSPVSPKLSYASWKYVSSPCFSLAGTPNRPNH